MALYKPMPLDTPVVCTMCEAKYKLGELNPQPDAVVTCPKCGAAVRQEGKPKPERLAKT